ncbi:MAG: nitronate monooxygenase [Calditrichaeota bacterium]|nr:nitronate monooxygenase [Calditrichota bacterium]
MGGGGRAGLPETLPTRITALYGIRYPIVQGGMIWTAGWKLAVAVSQAGGLGLIGAGSMKPDLLALHIANARAVWDGPLGVNIPLMRDDAADLVRVTLDGGIRNVFTSAGNPGKFTSLLKESGCIVTHVVPSLKLALKSVERGVDAVVGEGTEAGGHNGYEEVTTFVLTARLADHVGVPILAAGGIRDGRGLAAALALGADGVQVGTRFACTVESSASYAYKEAVVASGEPATTLTLKKLSPTRMLLGEFAQKARDAETHGASEEELTALLGRGRARRGTFDGDLVEGYMEAGEAAGDIQEVLPAGEVVRRMVEEYVTTVSKLKSGG